MLADWLNQLMAWVDKAIPVKGGRTALVVLAMLVKALAELVANHGTNPHAAQASSQQILLALGLLFAAHHVPPQEPPPDASEAAGTLMKNA